MLGIRLIVKPTLIRHNTIRNKCQRPAFRFTPCNPTQMEAELNTKVKSQPREVGIVVHDNVHLMSLLVNILG